MTQEAEHPPSQEPAPGQESRSPPARGQLKIYLGATPGAGKTYAMLREGHDLRSHGRDVVVGYVETYGRPRTVELLPGLDVIPRVEVEYRGTRLDDMDVRAVLERRPEIALVDELAHTNAPGLPNEKRWQDVEQLRDAGIDVITTLNVQHVESVKDLVENVTGIPVRETVPDRVLDSADVIQFIDIAPEALRKRMRHGNVYRREKVDTALANFFRPRNLAAMRQIGLRLVADSMAGSSHVVTSPEDVLVAVSLGDSSEELMRRGARLARRRGGSCVVVTVQSGPDRAEDAERLRELAGQLGSSFTVLGGNDVAGAIVQAARDVGAEHVLVGEVTGGGNVARLRPTIVDRIIDGLPDSDVHVIALVRHLTDAGQGAPGGAGDQRPDPMTLLRRVSGESRRRAMLRVYLGYAPGSGTTSAMLNEGRRRAARGTDVVAAAYRLHGDPAQALAGLSLFEGDSGSAAERALDLDAVLARNPAVVCIDDLAGPDVHGSPRLAAVPRLLDAGITVLATLHLLSIRSAAEAVSSLLSAAPDGPLIEDEFLSLIDELEVVDVPPGDLLRRIGENAVLTPAARAQAMQHELRPSVLTTLREMALRTCADQVDRQFVADMRESDGRTAPEVRGRIVLGIPVQAGLEPRIRDAARYAHEQDATFTVVTVRRPGLSEGDRSLLGGYATLTHQLGGELVRLAGQPVARTLARFVMESSATEVILGHRRRSRWWPWDTTSELIRLLDGVDIHVLRRQH